MHPHLMDSKFRFVLVAARRAEQLVRGARPRVEVAQSKPTRVAMEELRRGLVEWSIGRQRPAGESDEDQPAG